MMLNGKSVEMAGVTRPTSVTYLDGPYRGLIRRMGQTIRKKPTWNFVNVNSLKWRV